MALQTGQKAPDFMLASTSGKQFRLSTDRLNKPLVIYFYPKDFTPGCTIEACKFRDAFDFFRDLDMDVVGISRDAISTHNEFKKAHKLPFELLSDPDGSVARLYDATLPFINFTKRITYLLDKKHLIVACYQNLFGAKKHSEEMIKQINNIKFLSPEN